MIMVCVSAVHFAEIMVELIQPFLWKTAPATGLDIERLFKSLPFAENLNDPVAEILLADTRKFVWAVRIDTPGSLHHLCLASILRFSAPWCPFSPLGCPPQGAFRLFFATCLAYLPLWVYSVGHSLPLFLLWLIWPGNRLWFMWGKKKDWTGHHSRLRVFKRGKNWFFISWRIFPIQTKCEAPIFDKFRI